MRRAGHNVNMSIWGGLCIGITHLAQVELRILLGRNTLDLNQRGVGAGVALSALVAENASLAVKSA